MSALQCMLLNIVYITHMYFSIPCQIMMVY